MLKKNENEPLKVQVESPVNLSYSAENPLPVSVGGASSSVPRVTLILGNPYGVERFSYPFFKEDWYDTFEEQVVEFAKGFAINYLQTYNTDDPVDKEVTFQLTYYQDHDFEEQEPFIDIFKIVFKRYGTSFNSWRVDKVFKNGHELSN